MGHIICDHFYIKLKQRITQKNIYSNIIIPTFYGQLGRFFEKNKKERRKENGE